MTTIVSVHEAKKDLSRLLERISKGEEITITKSGKPVAKLVATSREPRKPGRLKGRIRMADDFETPLPKSLTAAFRGEMPRSS